MVRKPKIAPELEEWRSKIDNILLRRRHYRDSEFSAAALAEWLGITPFQLSRLLKKIYDKSYADIIMPYRVRDAKKMLAGARYRELTVGEIGAMVGFNNKWSFYQTFSRYVGMTPNEYREAIRAAVAASKLNSANK